MHYRTLAATALVLLHLFAVPVHSDVVKLHDGRRFEGTIVADNAGVVAIDTVVSTVRVTLSLKREEIESVEKKPVPAGFYDPAPAAPRISDPTKVGDPGSIYLEVPIKGDFGKDVRAAGVRAVFSYARAHRIGHIVFVIDSSGGDFDEAQEIYQLLKNQFGKVKLHAVVHNCLGDALAIPAVCDTVNLLPGSKIGGLGRKLSEVSDKHKAEDEAVLRRQIANELEAAAKQRGRAGRVVRAMVDPVESLAAWKDADGKVVLDSQPPADLPRERLIFTNGGETVLALTYEQAVALGLPPFEGGAKELGKVLGLSQWQMESDYGQRAMLKAAADAAKTAAAAQSTFDTKVKTNVARRETTERAIEQNMKQASEWAPTNESYATYQAYAGRWNWGWGRGYYGGDGGYDTNRLTPESRKKWRDRTDACMHYLVEARSARKTMQRLDKEALTLGLPPSFKEGELSAMIEDIEVKVVYLNNHRIRTSN